MTRRRNLLVQWEDVGKWPHRRDTELVDLLVTLRVVVFDVFELCRLMESRHVPIEVPEPSMDVGIATTDISNVAFEVLDIHRVEADDGRKEPHVSFGHILAPVEWSMFRLRQVFLDTIQRLEQLGDSLHVGRLRSRKARLVDAVVDVVVGPLVGLFDVLLQLRGKEVDFGLLYG